MQSDGQALSREEGAPWPSSPAAAPPLSLFLYASVFLICEMGVGQGWEPIPGGAMDKGNEKKGKCRSQPGHAGCEGDGEAETSGCLSGHSALIPELTNQSYHSVVTESFPAGLRAGRRWGP